MFVVAGTPGRMFSGTPGWMFAFVLWGCAYTTRLRIFVRERNGENTKRVKWSETMWIVAHLVDVLIVAALGAGTHLGIAAAIDSYFKGQYFYAWSFWVLAQRYFFLSLVPVLVPGVLAIVLSARATSVYERALLDWGPVLVYPIYKTLCSLSPMRASIGEWICGRGPKVDYGHPMTFVRALRRGFLWFIPD
jgi:hypothetical protein